MQPTASTQRASLIGLALLVAALVAGSWMRAPFLSRNLPLCVHTDERLNRVVLDRLENSGSLNPHFFNYPTLYFYATHFFHKLTGGDEVLFSGRLLNLLMSCALAFAVLLLARQVGVSPWGGYAAAAFTFFSPVMMESGEYITTDIMLPLVAIPSLAFLLAYFRDGRLRDWVIAIVLLGLAVSTKYTALLMGIAYVLYEIILPRRAEAEGPTGRKLAAWLNADNPRLIAAAAFAAAAALFALWAFFPFGFLNSVINSTKGVNSALDPSDLLFLEGIRRKVLLLAIAAAAAAGVVLKFKGLAARLSQRRIYAAGALAFLVFLLGTPFMLVSFKNFLYDFGYELKANAMFSDEHYWTHYIYWAFSYHGFAWFLPAALGFVAYLKRSREAWYLAIYLALFYVVTGSATRGYPRYLTAMMPIAFVLAAYGVETAWRWVGKRNRPAAWALVALVLVAGVAEAAPRVKYYLARAKQPGEFSSSYAAVLAAKPDTLRYAGFAPHFEIMKAGIPVVEIPDYVLEDSVKWAKVAGDSGWLLTDKTKPALFNASLAAKAQLLHSEEGWNGQRFFRYAPDSAVSAGR